MDRGAAERLARAISEWVREEQARGRVNGSFALVAPEFIATLSFEPSSLLGIEIERIVSGDLERLKPTVDPAYTKEKP